MSERMDSSCSSLPSLMPVRAWGMSSCVSPRLPRTCRLELVRHVRVGPEEMAATTAAFTGSPPDHDASTSWGSHPDDRRVTTLPVNVAGSRPVYSAITPRHRCVVGSPRGFWGGGRTWVCRARGAPDGGGRGGRARADARRAGRSPATARPLEFSPADRCVLSRTTRPGGRPGRSGRQGRARRRRWRRARCPCSPRSTPCARCCPGRPRPGACRRAARCSRCSAGR